MSGASAGGSEASRSRGNGRGLWLRDGHAFGVKRQQRRRCQEIRRGWRSKRGGGARCGSMRPAETVRRDARSQLRRILVSVRIRIDRTAVAQRRDRTGGAIRLSKQKGLCTGIGAWRDQRPHDEEQHHSEGRQGAPLHKRQCKCPADILSEDGGMPGRESREEFHCTMAARPRRL